jgi:hypothetical protein
MNFYTGIRRVPRNCAIIFQKQTKIRLDHRGPTQVDDWATVSHDLGHFLSKAEENG